YRTVGQTACPTSDHVDIRREYVRHAVDKPAVQFYSYHRSVLVKTQRFEAANFIASLANGNDVLRVVSR
ncbi:MAG TPA: hypothetical protein VF910_05445, partial [Candidatus Bathyarchaeia archaeon]